MKVNLGTLDWQAIASILTFIAVATALWSASLALKAINSEAKRKKRYAFNLIERAFTCFHMIKICLQYMREAGGREIIDREKPVVVFPLSPHLINLSSELEAIYRDAHIIDDNEIYLAITQGRYAFYQLRNIILADKKNSLQKETLEHVEVMTNTVLISIDDRYKRKFTNEFLNRESGLFTWYSRKMREDLLDLVFSDKETSENEPESDS